MTASRAMMARVSLASPFSVARPAVVEQLLAHRAVGQRGQQRLLGGVLQRDDILAFQPARLGRFHRAGDFRIRQAGKFGLVVQHQRAGLGGGDQLLLELGFQAGIFLVDRLQLRLVLVRQKRAGMHELAVIERQNLQRFGIQFQAGARVIERLHPREEFGIEEDGVAVRRQLRRFHRLHLVQGGIGVGLHHAEEGVADPVQHAARPLHRRDGVVEAGRARDCRRSA